MTPSQIVAVVIVVVAVAAILVAVVLARRAQRRRELRERFGPEYDRIVSERDSRSAAERELRERERRHSQLPLRPLDPEVRQRYSAAWSDVQSRFVDQPNQAVGEADELVTRLAAERGYPTEDYDEQLATLSVDHAKTLQRFRAAHDISRKNERGEATTEELRQALVHYRALFAELLEDDPAAPGHTPEQASRHASEQVADHESTTTGERASPNRRQDIHR